MQRIDLIKISHNINIGDVCGIIEPNIVEDSIFYEDGTPIGFYIKDISKYSEKAAKLADLADSELRSKSVPKSTMKRSSGLITTTVRGSRKEGEMWYWTVCKDYAMTWGVSKSIRATQKTVADQQKTVLDQLDKIKSEVVSFYEQLRETT